jgi:hypothetical protein
MRMRRIERMQEQRQARTRCALRDSNHDGNSPTATSTATVLQRLHFGVCHVESLVAQP